MFIVKYKRFKTGRYMERPFKNNSDAKAFANYLANKNFFRINIIEQQDISLF